MRSPQEDHDEEHERCYAEHQKDAVIALIVVVHHFTRFSFGFFRFAAGLALREAFATIAAADSFEYFPFFMTFFTASLKDISSPFDLFPLYTDARRGNAVAGNDGLEIDNEQALSMVVLYSIAKEETSRRCCKRKDGSPLFYQLYRLGLPVKRSGDHA